MRNIQHDENTQPKPTYLAQTFLTLLIFLLPALNCLATPGQLDPGFGNAGLLTINKPLGSIAKQPDGKLLLGRREFISINQPAKFSLTRYNRDGSVDLTFGNGEVITDFDGGTNSITSIAVQTNGKIVAAGHRLHNPTSDLVVARYLPDGSLDNSFDTDGKVTVTEFTRSIDEYTVAVQSDEKVVVSSNIAIIRFNADGSIDNSFGTAGRINFSTPTIMSIALQTDNKIVAVGADENGNFLVNRYNTNGTPDNSFDGDGHATTDFGGKDQALSVAIQSNGKIVVSGTYNLNNITRLALARYNGNGSPDMNFDADGKIVANGPLIRQTVLLQTDEKIVVAGGTSEFSVSRFNTNGTPDNSFDGDGYAYQPANNHSTFGAVISGNDVYIVGTYYYTGTSVVAAFSLDNAVVSGLSYRYYTGDFNTLPEFNTLTPVKTGITPNVDISVRPAGTNDHFAFVWEGFINIQTPGAYTFETVSDDGSKFYFNSFYTPSATALVSNDGLHAAQSASGSANITTAGLYPVAITYFEKDGGEAMQLYWSGPGIARQLIPDNVLRPKIEQGEHILPSAPGNLRVVYKGRKIARLDWENATASAGIAAYRVYNNSNLLLTTTQSFATLENLVPGTFYALSVKAIDSSGNISDFSNYVTFATASSKLVYSLYMNVPPGVTALDSLNPYLYSDATNIDLSVSAPYATVNYALRWDGFINIPTPGTYTFETISDDGSKFYFNTPYSSIAEPLVSNFENNGVHAPLSVKNTIVIPSAGVYPITMVYHQYSGGQTMEFYWEGPGIPRQRVPDAAFTDDSRPGFLTNGLNYKYYEGSWTTLPDFNALIPVQTGQSATVDISKRPAGKNDNFGFVWEGYINIPTAGDYTFETVSDDGSKLYFNSKYIPSAIATVNNDGLHAAVAAKATVSIAAPGTYPIAITFFENTGDQKMEVYWSGPFITRQLIPTEAFSPNPSTLLNRLSYKYFAGTWTALPDFSAINPVKTGTSANADINVRPAGSNDAFAFLWQGFISIPAPGNYTFETISDDGSKFYFNTFYNPGTAALVNNDGLHPATSATGTITIANAGVYPIAITFFEQYGGQSMEVYWTGPGIPRQRIPNDAFVLVNQSLLPSYPFIGTARQQSEAVKPAIAVAETTNLRSVYPNPFGESITIDFYNSVSTNDISIGLYDLNGRMVLTNHAGRLPAGNNIIKMNLNGINIKEGVYVVQVTKNGIAWKTAKVVKMKK